MASLSMESMLLGSRMTWEDFSPAHPDDHYPSLGDLKVCFVFAFVLLILRNVSDRFVMNPIAYMTGLHHTPSDIAKHKSIEEMYKRYRLKAPHKEIMDLAVQERMTVSEVESWLKTRRAMDKAHTLKFSESGWHVLYYSTSFAVGLYCLWKKSWFWNAKECFVDWPKQPFDLEVYWIYQIQMGFYISLLFTILLQRNSMYGGMNNDSTQMVCHHIIALLLMAGSYTYNFGRIGALVLVIHDLADPGLMLSKMCWIAKKKKAAEFIFVASFVVWVLSRIICFPYVVIWTTMVESRRVTAMDTDSGLWWIFNILLLLLLVLHIQWAAMFLDMITEKFRDGKCTKDSTSNDSDVSESDEEVTTKKTD